VLGVLLIIPIGGADMPVVVSMLNSYSGWAAAGIGFTLGNIRADHHRRAGGLVGRDPLLHHVQGMNRSASSRSSSAASAATAARPAGAVETRPVKQGSADDAAFIMKNAGKVIIVPGYGMAVAQAQHALREMADKLKEEGVEVKYAIHPVAGRMPGHMNVLLAEANVPYDEVFELEDINSEFAQADVAFVIGANDVTNPAAKTDKTSPIYGMPVLDVGRPARCCSSSAAWARAMPASRTAVLPRQHDDAVRRRQEDDRGHRQGVVRGCLWVRPTLLRLSTRPRLSLLLSPGESSQRFGGRCSPRTTTCHSLLLNS
jgi:NAD/NADP transhydrogenase beta subunit